VSRLMAGGHDPNWIGSAICGPNFLTSLLATLARRLDSLESSSNIFHSHSINVPPRTR
jgi:hypothetical protein